MAPKKKHTRWEPSFSETLRDKKEKEEAAYLAMVQNRTDTIKRTMTAQRRKDLYDKIMREFDDPVKRDSVSVETHQERIEFLDRVLKENLQWRERSSEPLQLKPNVVMLQNKIREMKEYVSARLKSGRTSGTSQILNDPIQEITDSVYCVAKDKILAQYSSIISRMASNVSQGLPIERATERLLALGVTSLVVQSLNEVIALKNLSLSDSEKSSIKLHLLKPERLNVFVEKIILDKNMRH